MPSSEIRWSDARTCASADRVHQLAKFGIELLVDPSFTHRNQDRRMNLRYSGQRQTAISACDSRAEGHQIYPEAPRIALLPLCPSGQICVCMHRHFFRLHQRIARSDAATFSTASPWWQSSQSRRTATDRIRHCRGVRPRIGFREPSNHCRWICEGRASHFQGHL